MKNKLKDPFLYFVILSLLFYYFMLPFVFTLILSIVISAICINFIMEIYRTFKLKEK